MALAGGGIWWWQPGVGGGPVIPPVTSTGGWSGRAPRVRREPKREEWPKYIELSDGSVIEARNSDEYAGIIGRLIAAQEEAAARAIAEQEAAQEELMARIAALQAETGRLRIEAIIAEAVAVHMAMLRADDDALILMLAQL